MKNVVLVIEDDDDFGQMLCTVISRKGILVKRICCAKDIPEAILGEEPALVLMDNHLVDGFGVTFVSVIKRVSPGSVVVLMTADDKHVLKQFPGFDKIDGFLGKPFSMQDLEPYLSTVAAS